MKLVNSFVDSNKQILRINVNMADVGSIQLPKILSGVQRRADELFDTAHYHIEFTGTTVTFLEGSAFIISGLKQSIVWAFFLIAGCMLISVSESAYFGLFITSKCHSTGDYSWRYGLGRCAIKAIYRIGF